jgi:hypothetical protein
LRCISALAERIAALHRGWWLMAITLLSLGPAPRPPTRGNVDRH